MSQDVVAVPQHHNTPVPFGPGANQARAVVPFGSVNAGAVAIEQERAVAEAQGQLTLAKKFPRDLNVAHSELMSACKSRAFADVAFYAVPNRGTGPTIRFAEEVARVYGNFQYGHRELSRDGNKSEIEVFAWDMEKNNRSIRQLTVMHVTDTKNGPKVLRDQADIDNKIANVASKQVRGRILALLPKWLVEDAIQECRKTIAGNNDEPIEARIRKMTQVFAKYGVGIEMLERHLGHKLDETTVDEIVDMIGMVNSLREGIPASELFAKQDDGAGEQAASTQAADAIKAAAQKGTQAAAATKGKPAATEAKAEKAEKAEAKQPQQAKQQQPETAPETKQDSKPAQQESKPAKDDEPPHDDIPPADQQQADGDKEADLF